MHIYEKNYNKSEVKKSRFIKFVLLVVLLNYLSLKTDIAFFL